MPELGTVSRCHHTGHRGLPSTGVSLCRGPNLFQKPWMTTNQWMTSLPMVGSFGTNRSERSREPLAQRALLWPHLRSTSGAQTEHKDFVASGSIMLSVFLLHTAVWISQQPTIFRNFNVRVTFSHQKTHLFDDPQDNLTKSILRRLRSKYFQTSA